MVPPETRSFFKKLLHRSEEFVFEELGRRINLLDKTQTFKITLKVVNELEHPLEKCFIFFRRGDVIIDGGLTDTNGIARIELPKGTYEVLIYKATEKWYVCNFKTLNVMRNITKQIRLKKETWPPKVRIIPIVKPPITIPCEIPLPKLPLEWLRLVDMHEKFMQMAFAAQLRKLGTFLGEKIIDARHTFTGFKAKELLREISYDPALKDLIVVKEMDVLALTENQKLIGFEHKSRKGIENGDYGFEDAKTYYYYGIEYMYVVHRETSPEYHKEILKIIERKHPTLGYIVYTPEKLKVMRKAAINPYISNEQIRKRGEHIKKRFSYAGSTNGPY